MFLKNGSSKISFDLCNFEFEFKLKKNISDHLYADVIADSFLLFFYGNHI